MGFLTTVGSDIAQAFMPTATAGSAAARSLQLGTLATGVNVASQIASGVGGFEQANFAAKMASGNADAARAAGQEAETASKMKYGKLEAQQIATQAANGIQVREGSAARTVAATEALSSMDAALIHYNAARQAYGEDLQSSVYKKAGTGALAKGLFNAGTSFLSDAQSLSDKWLQYKLSGATTAKGY